MIGVTFAAAFLLILKDVDGQLKFDTSTVSSNGVQGLVFKNRLFVPYGPDLTTAPPQNGTNGEVWKGYGFGTGAVEHFAYDPVQGYVYTQSEIGAYITIIDYSSIETNGGLPAITPYSIDLTEYDSEIRDVAVCGDHLMIVATDENLILHYETVKRAAPFKPKLISKIVAGMQPDNIRFNNECTILAVANENDGSSAAVGAIHLVTDFDQNSEPTVREVSFAVFNDEYLLGRDVHMSLTLNAMIYWDDNSDIATSIDWSSIRDNYNPSLFMQPEFIQFSPDSKTLLVNLQGNSALARIDILTATLVAVDGYGLKSWTEGEGIDIVDDEGCAQSITHPLLYSLRSPDGIASVEIDGMLYVLTAEEGSDFEYGDFEEKTDAGDFFNGMVLGQQGFVVDATIFSTNFSEVSNFNSACQTNESEWCASGLQITLGSSAVNYTNTTAPNFQSIVAFGGRGISIYRVPSASDDVSERIERVWDSKSEFEQIGCSKFPWAHNGVQDDAFAPLDGALYQLSDSDGKKELDDANDPGFDGCEDSGNGQPGACPMSETVDAKALEEGLAPESVVVAIACDRLLAVSCGENNGNCYLYDITTIANPVFIQVFNLSPASEKKSPGVAYANRTLGDVDAETVRFVPANESPTGLAGIMFGGAHSGTLSFYEFECSQAVDPVTTVFVGTESKNTTGGGQTPAGADSSNIDNESSDGLSSGAKAGIAVGVLAGVGILFALYMMNQKRPTTDVGMEATKPAQDADLS